MLIQNFYFTFENSTDLAQLTPNQKPFRGCWGCLASLRSCEHLPARLQPPRGWADGGRPRGLRPDHSRVPPVDPAACTGDAPMWCDGGGLRLSPWGPYFSWYSSPAPQVAPGLLGVINQRAAAPLHRPESSALGCALWRARLVEKVDLQIEASLSGYRPPVRVLCCTI